jgi:hypothetical protein
MLADRLLLRHPEVPNLQIPALINATQRRLSASRSWQLSAYALSIFLGRKCESCRSMKIYIYMDRNGFVLDRNGMLFSCSRILLFAFC